MRDTVSLILRTEAERLYAKSKEDGLNKDDLGFLDKLIATHKNFIGETASQPASELPPEKQSTDSLLSAIETGPPSVNPPA